SEIIKTVDLASILILMSIFDAEQNKTNYDSTSDYVIIHFIIMAKPKEDVMESQDKCPVVCVEEVEIKQNVFLRLNSSALIVQPNIKWK
ncbi:22866_t:CDS:2, partial [Dentiscutata erythropus]